MRRVSFFFLFVFFLLAPSVLGVTIFEDDFNRADNAVVGNGWGESENTGVTAEIISNVMKLTDASASFNVIANQSTFSYVTPDIYTIEITQKQTNNNEGSSFGVKSGSTNHIDFRFDSSGQMTCCNNNDNNLRAYSADTYYDLKFIVNKTGGDVTVFVDDVDEGTYSLQNTGTTDHDNIQFSTYGGGLNDGLFVDDIIIYNGSLILGSHVRVLDGYNSSAIDGATVCLTTDDVCNITDTSGVAYFYGYSGQGFNVSDADYIGSSGFAVENTTTNIYIFQAWLNVSVEQLFTGSSINVFNVSNGVADNSTSSGSLLIGGRAGLNEVNVSGVEGNYSVLFNCTGVAGSVSSCLVDTVFDNLFRINASDALTGDVVSSFSVEASHPVLGSSSLNSSSDNIYFNLVQGYEWNFLIDASGFSYSNVSLSANQSSNEYEFFLLPSNSVFVYFYETSSLESITENVSVIFSKGNVSVTNSSVSGDLLFAGLDAGTWEVDVSSPLYESSQYFVTVGSRSSQVLDAYLLNSTLSGETTITVKDSDDGSIIQGAVVSIQIRDEFNNWVSYDQQVTDIFGVSFFNLVQGEEYQMIIEASGYTTKTGTFVRSESSYIVPLVSANTQDFTTYLDEFTYVISPSDVAPEDTNFSLVTSSPLGKLVWFASVIEVNGTEFVSNVTGSPSGGTALVNINLTPYAGKRVYGTFYMKSTGFDDPLIISRNWYVYSLDSGNYTFVDFMSFYGDDDSGTSVSSRAILSTVGAVIVAAAFGLFFGFEAALLGACAMFILAGIYGWVHWGVVIVVVTALLGTVVVRSRGGL